ncbi:unnamed protein product [Rhizoctonia solani]|uniref:Phospholipid/glycerol acyltransferase domain-containing protein n=1 Tax=Rhizoctonia solani TaxID=456999 RepID=A0A8H3BHA6_9AGAM|nr:unnamed protein product [Rhizoctonia solani]
MQRKRSGASANVRFASEAGSRRTTVTSITEEGSSARTSSIDVAQVDAAGRPIYELWEPPEETVLDHCKPINEQGKDGVSAGTKLGQIVAAVVRSRYTGGSVYLPRFSRSSLTRTRSVASESDVASVSRDELIRDVRKLGLPVRTPNAPPASARPPPPVRAQPPAPRVTPLAPRSAPPIPQPTLPTTTPRPAPRTATAFKSTFRPTGAPTTAPTTAPTIVKAPAPVTIPSPARKPDLTTKLDPGPKITPPPKLDLAPRLASTPRPAPAPIRAPPAPPAPPVPSTSRTLANVLAPSTTSLTGMSSPISTNTYRVWRASLAKPRNLRYPTSPYTQMINDAAYKPKLLPPPGTIIESSGEGLMRAERALYAELSIRPVDERLYWTMPPDHDERVRNRIRDVDKASRELALYGLDMYLALGVKGAIMTNAGYHAPEWPDSPAYDWITFDDARKTGDKVLQESIAFTYAFSFIFRRFVSQLHHHFIACTNKPGAMSQAKKPDIKPTPWAYFFVRSGLYVGGEKLPPHAVLATQQFVLKVFYGTIVVENEHFIPSNGEACNSLTDALVLVASVSSKFGKPTFQSWLIESAGTLPIKRRKDHAEGQADNTVVMEALVKALTEGDAICLFPEGMSRYHPSVAPMKTGVARIASDVLTQQKDNPDFRLTLLTCSITYMHREHFRSDVLVSFNPPLQLDPKTHSGLLNCPPNEPSTTQHAVRSLTTFLYDQITQGTITAPSWKIIRTAKAAARIYVPLGTGMGLGDWVRVVGRFAGEAGFGGVGKIRSRKSSLHSSAPNAEKSRIAGAQWQPGSPEEENIVEKIEPSSVSDEFVETLAQDVQLYQTHLERLGLKDFRVLQYNTLSRRRIASRILIRMPLILVLVTLALPGLVLWLPVFATVSYFTKKHKQTGPVWDTYDEISQTKLIYGLAAGTITWLSVCIITLPFASATALFVPGIMWMTLRWTEDLVAGVRSIVALTRLLLVGKPEMNKTLLWREDIHARIMELATERLELPANPEKFFSTKSSPGPRWDTKGGADKGRTQGLWARGARYFSLRRRRKRDWNETMRWYDQTYLPEDEL